MPTIEGSRTPVLDELSGRAVVLANGIAGTVDKVWSDKRFGGLRMSIRGHDGEWWASMIKSVQGEIDGL